jgi:hypothetical protein
MNSFSMVKGVQDVFFLVALRAATDRDRPISPRRKVRFRENM